MKVLVSACACEPGKCSEPGVGWNWVRQIARPHEVWELTLMVLARLAFTGRSPQGRALYSAAFAGGVLAVITVRFFFTVQFV